jgi:hypothetical protein
VRSLGKIDVRIKELGDKSTQLLLFLSFSFVAVVTMKSDHTIANTQQHALTIALRWWVWALLPVLAGIVPLKDFNWQNPRWYNAIRRLKICLLWAAIFLILIGAWYFGAGIWPVEKVARVPQSVPMD